MRKLTLFLLLAVFVGLQAVAIPAHRGSVLMPQPDGTLVTVCLEGDEFYHFNTTADGYTIMLNEAGAYVYAQADGMNLVPTQLLAHDVANRTAAELSFLAGTPKYLTDETEVAQGHVRRVKRNVDLSNFDFENFRGLVILIDFSDKSFASADPIQKAWSEVDSRMDFNPRAELQDVITLLNALQNGEPLPEAGGKTKEIPDKINRLNSGLQDLNNGAQTLSEGAEALNTGLAALSSNSEALNSGADTIFSAILETANQQLAASGLAEAGIEVPVLTADNYADTLTSLLAQFDTETVTAAARSQVEAVVRPQVKASEGKIRSAVTETVQAQVLEQVLVGAGMEMNAETYLNAVRAGQVEHTVQQKIQAAVDTQMETDTVKELIEAHTAEQIEQLVSDNTDQVLATDETVAAKLAQVQAAHDSLQGLLEELNKVGTFVTGLKTYTAGVDQAAAGAADLSSGAAALHDSGTDTLLTAITGAEKTVAEKLLPVLTGDISAVLDAWNQISGKTAGYDLRNEAFETTTLYVIRTDFN